MCVAIQQSKLDYFHLLRMPEQSISNQMNQYPLQKARGVIVERHMWRGIFMNAKQTEPGVWTGSIDTSRIFNHNEMPQFIDYGVSGSATRALTYCGRDEKCE